MIWGVRGPLYQALAARAPASGTYRQIGVGQGPGFFKIVIAVNHIAAQMADGTPLTAEERDLVSGLYPLENGKWPYGPSADDRFGIGYAPALGRSGSGKKTTWQPWPSGFLGGTRMASLRHVLTSTSYLWRITGRAGLDNYYTVAFVPGKKAKYQKLRDFHVSGDENVDWVEPKVPLPGVVNWTFRNAWLFWRPALYLYLILFSLAIAMLREGIDAVWRRC